jgi:hypothetical protein
MWIQAYIMNRKNAKTTAKISTAQVATNKANRLSIVTIKIVPPLN